MHIIMKITTTYLIVYQVQELISAKNIIISECLIWFYVIAIFWTIFSYENLFRECRNKCANNYRKDDKHIIAILYMSYHTIVNRKRELWLVRENRHKIYWNKTEGDVCYAFSHLKSKFSQKSKLKIQLKYNAT
jgi:hypothetical protein